MGKRMGKAMGKHERSTRDVLQRSLRRYEMSSHQSLVSRTFGIGG